MPVRKLSDQEAREMLGEEPTGVKKLPGSSVPKPKRSTLKLAPKPSQKPSKRTLGVTTGRHPWAEQQRPKPTPSEITLEDYGVSTEGAPASVRRVGGYATDPSQKIMGVKSALEKEFGRSVPVRRGPASKDIEFLNPKTLKWTTYKDDSLLSLGDVASLEAEAYPTAGGVVGGAGGMLLGAPAGPGAMRVGGYTGEAIGSFIGEFARLKKGQEENAVRKDRSNADLAAEAATTAGIGTLIGGGLDMAASQVRRQVAQKFGIDLDIDELKQRLQDRMGAHERVGTSPTTGQIMRGTPAGDELLQAEKMRLAQQGAPGQRELAERELGNLQQARRAFNQATLPDEDELASRQSARAIEDIPNIAQQRQNQYLEAADAQMEGARENVLRAISNLKGQEKPENIGRNLREEAQQATEQFYEQAERNYYGPIRAEVGNQTIKPTNTFETARQYSEAISNDLIPRLTEEDDAVLQSILKQEKEVTSPILTESGQPARQGRQIPSVQYDQLDRALSALRRYKRNMNRGTIPERNRKMINELEAAVNKDLNSLLSNRPELLQRKRAADVWYREQQETLREKVMNEILEKRPGETGYKVPNEDVIEKVLKPGGQTYQAQITNALSVENNDAAKNALSEALQRKYRQDVMKGDEVDPEAHTQFLEDYRTAIERLWPDQLRQNLNDASSFTQQFRNYQQQKEAIKEELKQTTEGKIASLDPGEVFQQTWKNEPMSREVFQLIGDDSNLGRAYKWHIRQDMMKNVTKSMRNVVDEPLQGDRRATGKMIDPDKLRSYLDDNEDKLRMWFGDDYISNLDDIATVIDDVTAKPNRPVKPQGPINAVYDLARAYVGMFTRPGRVVTAVRKLRDRGQKQDLTQALLDPQRLARVNELSKAGAGTQRAAAIMMGANINPALVSMASPTQEDIDRANNPDGAGSSSGVRRLESQRSSAKNPQERQVASRGGAPSGVNYGFSDRLLDRIREVESSNQNDAISPAGARGPYQIMPMTGRDYGIRNVERLHDPNVARPLAAQILRDYTNMFGGDLEKGLAAYNWGPGNLQRAIDQHGDKWKRNLPKETENYLKKLRSVIRNERMQSRR